MKKNVLLTLICLLGFSAPGATKDDPSITVNVEEKMLVEPDRAYLLIYSKETDSRSENAIEKSLENIEKVMDAIRRKNSAKISYDILNNGITRIDYTIPRDGKTGYDYIGMHCVRINCSPKDEKLFPILDDANTSDLDKEDEVTINKMNGINSGLPFSPIIYAVEDYQAAEDQLEAKALAAAKVRAEKLAKKAGKTIGDIISIELGLISARGRGLDLPTPYISDNRNGVMMVQSATVTYQLLP
jgi:uncharacterized protein YggE